MKNAFIYDFETLSQNPLDCALISCACLSFDLEKLESGSYTYDELLSKTKYIKFDVEQQVKQFNRKVDKETLEWWREQGPEAIKKLKRSSEDVSIEQLPSWVLTNMPDNCKYVFTRNNTFDPVILKSVCDQLNQTFPYPWWTIRDTKSFIFGLSYTMDIKDTFIPVGAENYVKHDPVHDVCLDVMRMQNIISHICE